MLNKIKNRVKILINFFQLMKVYKSVDHQYDHHKIVYFNLSDIRLEAYYYPLIYFFAKSGYTIYLKKNLWYLGHNFNAGKFIFKIPSLIIGTPIKNRNDIIYITDKNTTDNTSQWKQTFNIDTNIYHHLWNNTKGEIFPFPMNPNMYDLKLDDNLDTYRNRQRSLKIFFSGNCDKEAYNNPIFKSFFQLLNRYETLDSITKHLPEETIVLKEPSDYEVLKKNSYLNKFILMDWTWTPNQSKNLSVRVPNEEWLHFMAQSDFFLCCVGISMPLSFNAIEAMAVGTIPIIEYNKYFSPELEHMKNAIVFKGREDLIDKIKIVLNLSEDEIAQLKKNVIKYYDNNHKPESFCNKLENSKETKNRLYLHATSISHKSYLENKYD